MSWRVSESAAGMSPRLGGARRSTQLQVVCSDSLSASTPALHLLCSHHSGQLAAVTAQGTCPSPRGHPLVSMAPVSLHCGFCSLCPSSGSLSSSLPFSFRLQVATCVFLGSGCRRSLGGALPYSPFSSSRPSLVGQCREDGPGRSALSPKYLVTHHLNQIILCS